MTPGPMAPRDLTEEEAFLRETVAQVRHELYLADEDISATASDLDAQKDFLWEHRRDMDGSEKAAFRGMVDVEVSRGESVVRRRAQLERLAASPYFARVDFEVEDAETLGAEPSAAVYIGTHSFRDVDTRGLRIHDWRAPISSLYYDYETGPAEYVAPHGRVAGSIARKFQYKTHGDELEFRIESSLSIGDELLQRELSRSGDQSMRNIVATIQREQNAVIRNETADVLILQGVAGSGKTSIALHRVAFLLYRFADTLNAQDVLVISPNRVFGDYIADVLPELGEEAVPQTQMNDIALRLLNGGIAWQTFPEQVAELMEPHDESVAERIRFRSRAAFVDELDAWIDQAPASFEPASIEAAGERLDPEWVRETFTGLGPLPLFTRIDRVVDAAVAVLKQRAAERHRKWKASDTTLVRRQVSAMLPWSDALTMYEAFYAHRGCAELFQRRGRKTIEFADVFPLLYVTLKTARVSHDYGAVRHLIVDEMQDYTPVQYAVLRLLFTCRMTILGDANQSVNPFSSSHAQSIAEVFPQAEVLELQRSYRSTRDITEFALAIAPNDRVIPVDRRGVAPTVTRAPDRESQAEVIGELIEAAKERGHRAFAIIAKTTEHAARLAEELPEGVGATVLAEDVDSLSATVVASAQMSKGLEFDAVIVPDADEVHYATEMDRGLLYIACTRAMHELHLTYTGQRSPLLPPSQ